MKSKQKIAVVTGANRGIGLEISRQLAKQGIEVVMTARDKHKGLAVVNELTKQELPVRFFPVDVNHAASINQLKHFMDDEFGRCDILVNNAGIFPDTKNSSAAKFPSVFHSSIDTIREAMETNVYGSLLMIQAMVPLMKKNKYGRIVNLSSGMGQLTHMNGGCPGYRISKTSINALTRIVSEELKDTNILVNSMCPGWVKTEMGGPNATRSLAEGAETAIFLSTLPDDGPTGKFFRDKKEFDW